MATKAADGYESTLKQRTLEQRTSHPQYDGFSIPVPGSRRKIEVSLGYRRGLDFDQEDQPGQDFVTVRGDGGFVVGVVADGVGESFYGDLAARSLSVWLLERLWQECGNPPSRDQLERELKKQEREIAEKVVEPFPIPDHLASHIRKILEARRPKGSQTVFAAFVLDAQKSRLSLYQVGDVDVLVHYPRRLCEFIKAPEKGRWSSAGKSEMHLRSSTYEDASGIVVQSDGAGKGWGRRFADVLSKSAFELLANERAGKDDVSFVATSWGEVLDKAPLETEIKVVRPPGPPLQPREEKTIALAHLRPSAPRDVPSEIEKREEYAGSFGTGRRGGDARPSKSPRSSTVTRGIPFVRRLSYTKLLSFGALVAGVLAVLLVTSVYLTAPPVENEQLGVAEPPEPNEPSAAKSDGNEEIETNGTVDVPASDVPGNDTAPTNDALPLDEVRTNHGTLTPRENGSFTYVPDPGFVGEDFFTYDAEDGGERREVTVTVVVGTSNNPPSDTVLGDPNTRTPPQNGINE